MKSGKKAEEYFKKHPHKTRFRESKFGIFKNKDTHTFIRADKEGEGQVHSTIYATSRTKYFDPNEQNEGVLGKGNFGSVKICQDKQGNNFAIKAEKHRSLREESDAELQLLKELNYFKGQALHSGLTSDKLYTVMTLFEGKDLTKAKEGGRMSRIFSDEYLKPDLMYALKCCLSIQDIHDRGYIHGDIHTDNFMVNKNDHQITVMPIDFGLSLTLPKGKQITSKSEGIAGRHGYMAPEIQESRIYSHATDTYAMGKMFTDDFLLTTQLKAYANKATNMSEEAYHHLLNHVQLYKNMSNNDAQNRPQLSEVSLALISDLRQFELTPQEKAMLDDHETQAKATKNTRGFLNNPTEQNLDIMKNFLNLKGIIAQRAVENHLAAIGYSSQLIWYGSTNS